MSLQEGITIQFDGRSMDIKCCFIGGVTADKVGVPMGMYAGKLEIEEIAVSLVHVHRAVIKLFDEHYNINLKGSVDFINLCKDEAVKREQVTSGFDKINLDVYDILTKMTKDNS